MTKRGKNSKAKSRRANTGEPPVSIDRTRRKIFRTVFEFK